MIIYRCWPKHWLEAACKAGLAEDRGDEGYRFQSDEMRDKLEVFAQNIQDRAEALK